MRRRLAVLALGAIGVVYGDIGTSPLYTLQVTLTHDGMKPTPESIFGVLSLIFWAQILVVSLKYVVFIMRADNKGEGGIMALMALAQRSVRDRPNLRWVLAILGIFGASLFASSGASSSKTASPRNLSSWVVPVTLVILLALFAIQRRGTEHVGRLFGPIMVVWFVVIALLGVRMILINPHVLKALNPIYGVRFFESHGFQGFIALGGVVLALTGAEREGRTDIRGTCPYDWRGSFDRRRDARDFDDAVFAEPRRGGGFRLLVAIADVSHYVRIGSALDKEAFERSTSTYFPGYVVPMLPETLSNGICSLNPKVERLCMVCDMQVDADGNVVKSKFYDAVMRSHARLTYDKVWQAVGLREADALHEVADVLPQLENLHALYKAMVAQRKRRGAIDFETPEVKFRLDQTGSVESMGATERNDAHKLIEECMIAANVQAALFLEKKKIPALFRAHEPPPAAEKKYGGDFAAEVLRMVKDRPERELIQSVLLRSQSIAAYQPDNRGHFGLALTAYAHFTSPIRRYPDLLVHRAIRYALTTGKPSDYSYSPAEMAAMAIHCSQRERRAEEAERDVDERFKCAWMEKHIGSEFDGVVTGVTSFGLFVELNESKVSGLVHISQLANDYYHFDAIRKLLKGAARQPEDRKIDFRMVPSREVAPAPQAAGKAYNYAASGERYSLPTKPAAAAKPPGMFGRAAKAIGRAFGRKEAPRVAIERQRQPFAARPFVQRIGWLVRGFIASFGWWQSRQGPKRKSFQPRPWRSRASRRQPVEWKPQAWATRTETERQAMSESWIVGINPVEGALSNDAERVKEVLIEQGHAIVRRAARILGIVCAPEGAMEIEDRVTPRPREQPPAAPRREARHQGVAALYEAPPLAHENDLAGLLERDGAYTLVLVLDGVTDPHNLIVAKIPDAGTVGKSNVSVATGGAHSRPRGNWRTWSK
ncbi:MAG: hypothetical protein WDW38_006624 [Sanguina aurantia]